MTLQVKRTSGPGLTGLAGFQADCPVAVVVGNWVYITGPAVLTIPQVDTVDIKTTGKYPAIGMVVEKSTPTRCLVIVGGEVAFLPATLIPGARYWVGTDGNLTATLPLAGVGERVATQVIGYALDADRLLIHPERRPIISTA